MSSLRLFRPRLCHLLLAGLLLTPAGVLAYDRADYRAEELAMDADYAAGNYEAVEAATRAMMERAAEAFGAESIEVLKAETALANALDQLGRRSEALEHFRHVHATAVARYTEYNPFSVRAAMALGVALAESGAPEEALPLVAGAVKVAEATLGPADPTTITWRYNLAGVFQELYYLDEALAAYRTCLAGLREQGERRTAAIVARQIARVLRDMGERSEAVSAYAEALQDYRAVFGPQHPDTVDTMSEYGLAMWRAGEREALAPLVDETERATLAAYGADNIRMAEVWQLKALLLSEGGPSMPRFAEALGLQARAVALKEKLLTPTNSSLGGALIDLAAMLDDFGDARSAYDLARRAEKAGRGSRQFLYQTAKGAEQAGVLDARASAAEALRIAQVTQASAAASATMKLGIRLALGDGEAGRNYRRTTDLVERTARLQELLLHLTGLPPDERDTLREEDIRRELAENEAEIARLRDLVAAEQPVLADLVGGREMTLDALQARLGPDEAVVILDVDPRPGGRHVVIAVSRERAEWAELLWTAESFNEAVEAVRASIGERLGTRAGVALRPKAGAAERGFALEDAHWLYAETVGQVEGVIEGKTHLYFDLRGALAALPPALLVSRPPESDDPAKAHYLIRDHAVTVLPSLISLTTADLAVGRGRAGEPMLGFADPVYDLADLQLASADAGTVVRGALAPLPETAVELRAVGATLGAQDPALRTGLSASEAELKRAKLDDFRMLYFATHGLVAGDAVGETMLGEPALALTAGGGEDGLLTASEILSLHLNADWVVLSACNTAVGNKPGEQALSGLAQAFIYAGARALLVSHWPVESHSAVALMTDIFARRAADPSLSAAEAQRRAMLAMIDAPQRADWSHPAYWAPFILVGDPG